jgi:molecular chaperone GrpE
MRSTDDDDDESLGPVIRDRRRIDPVTGQARDTGRTGASRGGQGQTRPGKHSASKPGGQPGGAKRGPAAGSSSAAGSSNSAAGSSNSAAGSSSSADRQAPAAAPAAGAVAGDGQASGAAAAAKLAERTADLQRLQAEYANYRKRVERDRMAVREQALANVLSALLPILDDIGRAREHGELEGGFRAVAESLEAAAVKLGLSTYGEKGDAFDPNVHEALMHSYSDEVSEPTCVLILQPGYKVADRILRPARVAVAEPGQPASEPAAGQPAADEPAASDPGEPGAGEPGAGEPGAGEPGRPASDHNESSSGQAGAGQPGDHAPAGTD